MTGIFDNLKDRYEEEMSHAMSGFPAEHQFFIEVKARKIEEWAARLQRGAGKLLMLDVGCGTGLLERFLRVPESETTGIDIALPLLEKARENAPGCRFEWYDGRRIGEPENSYDLVFAVNVFHHVPMSDRMGLLMEMRRVLRPGGLMALFEHNPLNPVTRFVVSRCAFDRGAVLMSRSKARACLQSAGLIQIASSYMIFLPWGQILNRALEWGLGWAPLGVQYYVTGVK